MNQPTAEQALRQLESLVGEWIVEAKWPNGEPWPGGGRIIFEWLASGAHLLQRGTVELPQARQYLYHRMRRGERDVLPAVLRRARRLPRLSDDHRQRRVEALAGGRAVSQRFIGTFSDDGNMITGRWEIAKGGTNYTTDFDLIYRRVSDVPVDRRAGGS